MALKKLIIEEAEYSPYIEMSPGFCVIKGRAILEDSFNFFTPVIEWLTRYANSPEETTTFIFDLDVYDSSVIRRLTEIMELLKQTQINGSKIKVIWKYHPEDISSQHKGYEFSKFYNFEFELVPKKIKNES